MRPSARERTSRSLLGAIAIGSATSACSLIAGLHDYAPPADGGAPLPEAAYADSDSVDDRFDAGWTFVDNFDDDPGLALWSMQQVPTGTFLLPQIGTGCHSGCCCLIAGEHMASSGAFVAKTIGPLASGTFALRVWFASNDESLAGRTEDPTVTFVQLTSAGAAAVSVGQAPPGQAPVWAVQAPAAVSDAGIETSNPNANPNWHCVELVANILGGGTAAQVTLYVDANQVLTTTTTSGVGPWDTLVLGVPFASGAGAAEVFYDDLVAAQYADTSPSAHIGCSGAGP